MNPSQHHHKRVKLSLNSFRRFHGTKCLNVLESLFSQGFEPSATTSIRRELRLMSRCSRWATRAQCMSRDFTHATLATHKTHKQHNCVYNKLLTITTSNLQSVLVTVSLGALSLSSGWCSYLCAGRLSGSRTEDWPSWGRREYWWRASCSLHSVRERQETTERVSDAWRELQGTIKSDVQVWITPQEASTTE